MKKHYKTMEKILSINESIPHNDENSRVKYRLLEVAKEVEELIDELAEMKQRPKWTTLLWDCVLFLSTTFIIGAYIQRTADNPNRSFKEAPKWAWGAVIELQRIFKLDRFVSIPPHRVSSMDFQNLSMKRTEQEEEFFRNESTD